MVIGVCVMRWSLSCLKHKQKIIVFRRMACKSNINVSSARRVRKKMTVDAVGMPTERICVLSLQAASAFKRKPCEKLQLHLLF